MKGPSFVKSILWRSLCWCFLAVLGSLLLYGLTGLKTPADLNPTFHVASRYVDQGFVETGWSSSFLAALLDYRAFYLMLLGLLALSLVLGVSLFSVSESFPLRPIERLLLAAALCFLLGLLIWGAAGFWNGGNWMDYEFLSGSSARTQGGWVSGLLLTGSILCSLLSAYSVWSRGKGQFLGRR